MRTAISLTSSILIAQFRILILEFNEFIDYQLLNFFILVDSSAASSQYREQGAHYWRGFTIDQMINQCIGNNQDGGKGRQMPVHYGSKAHNLPTVSSPLSNSKIIKLLRFLKLQDQVMPSEQQMRKKLQLYILEKEQPVKVIFQPP